MKALNRSRYFVTLVTLMIFMSVTALASEGDAPESTEVIHPAKESAESMIVNASWLDNEMLRIDVTDTATGSVSSLAIRLSDFAANTDNSPTILIQAVDLDGNISGIIEINNPFYIEPLPAVTEPEHEPVNNNEPHDPPVESPNLGLTPEGSGTVVDNIVNQNGVEFFTVFTEQGNPFFLVVDRHSNTENVHLLNAVTEADLMALAERSGNPIEVPVSAIPPIEELQPPVETEPPESETEESENSGFSFSGRLNNLILILVITAIAGGAAVYFRVIRPRKAAAYDDDEEEDEFGYDDAVSDGGGSDDRESEEGDD